MSARYVGTLILTLLAAEICAWAGAAPAHALAPLSMEGADGQGLLLESMAMKVAAHGALSLTEMDMVFRNPKPRQAEGKFQCTLPPGATVSRFAKEVDGKLMEGEVVERQKAVQVYTQILHQMRDPALLEQDQGNVFNARVFPIPASGTVRLLLSYSRSNPVGTDGLRRISVPLRGLPTMKKFDFLAICRPLPGESVQLTDASGATRPMAAKTKVLYADEMAKTDFEPTADVELLFKAGADAQRTTMLRAGDFQMACIRPDVPAPADPGKRVGWTVAMDTSASQATGLPHRQEVIAEFVKALAAADQAAALRLRGFDVGMGEAVEAAATEAGVVAALAKVTARGFAGGTDLVAAATALGEEARREAAPRGFALLTDGVATFGVKEPGQVVKALGAWPERHVLHVVVVGSAEESRMTEALADAGRGRVVRIPLTDAWKERVAEAVASLRTPVGVTVNLYDEGAEWLEPAIVRDVRPGQELVVYSHLKGGAASQLGLTFGRGTDRKVVGEELRAPEFAPLLEREAFRARLAQLERVDGTTEDPAKRAQLKAEMVAVSVGHRVLCPLTSLLVLESEADYRRYGIDRRALGDIISVGDEGIALVKRAANVEPATPEPPKRPETTKTDSFGDRLRGMFKSKSAEAPSAAAPSARAAAANESDGARADRSDSFEDRSGGAPLGGAPADAAPSEEEADAEGAALPAAPAPSGPGGNEFGATAGSRGMPEPLPQRAAMREMSRAFAPPPPPPAPAQALGDGRLAEPREEAMRRSSDTLAPSVVGLPRPAPRPTRVPPGVVPMPVKAQAPSWTDAAGFRPDDALLERMRASVKEKPQDRLRRNALGWCLARSRKFEELRDMALEWQPFDPGNPMLYEFLGQAYEGLRDDERALRAYTSIAEVSPGDSGLLNRAGYLLLRLNKPQMAETVFRFAIERRPDHHNNFRGLSLALWFQGRYADAAKALEEVLAKDLDGRYRNVKRVLVEELGYVLKAWISAKPDERATAEAMARKYSVDMPRTDALRITLHWETDATDVDLHVVDPNGEECYYSHKQNASGLELYEDLTQGLGPEVVRAAPGKLLDGAYHVGVKYFSAGPMGVSRGIVVIRRGGDDKLPSVQIEPFCLLPDLEGQSQDMRHVAVVEK